MLCKSGSSKMPRCSNSQSAKLICGFAVLGTFQSPLFSKPDPSLASKLGDFATRPGTADRAEYARCRGNLFPSTWRSGAQLMMAVHLGGTPEVHYGAACVVTNAPSSRSIGKFRRDGCSWVSARCR